MNKVIDCDIMADKRIDIGCGEKPQVCFDVYTDIYQPKVEVPGKFVLCSVESMPFQDDEFSYSRCHHVIEHTSNPDRACRELIRISKAGTLWFPTPQAELLFGRADHRWFVFVERGKLLFVAKRFASYKIKCACLKSIEFLWEKRFSWEIVS